MPNAVRALADSVRFAETAVEAIEEADVVLLATAWDEFRALEPSVFEREGAPRVLVDCWRLLSPQEFNRTTEYVALGEGSPAVPPVAFAEYDAPGRS